MPNNSTTVNLIMTDSRDTCHKNMYFKMSYFSTKYLIRQKLDITPQGVHDLGKTVLIQIGSRGQLFPCIA